MNPETQFKKFSVLILLFMAILVVMNSPDMAEFKNKFRKSLLKKFFSYTESVEKEKENEESLFSKFSHSLNPKKYWISGNIRVNGLSDYNRKSKSEIYTFRKYYVNKTIFKNKDYVPNEEVFGKLGENKVWVGIKAYSCIGANTLSYRSMSKESKFINNPAVLVGVEYATFPSEVSRCSEQDYLIPKSMSFSKDKNSFVLTYVVSEKNKSRLFKLIGLNARDLGFKYGYCMRTNNIEFANSIDNISKNIYMFKDAIRPDASCGVKGGCNNNLAYQEELFFNILNSPATFELKLWKENPTSIKTPAGMNFTIILE